MTQGPATEASIFLIRHGRTAANAHTYVGRRDEPLDETGRQQAAGLVARLGGRPIQRIYASPLSRARDTAQPLATAHGLSVVVDPDLIEMDFGTLHGARKADRPVRVRRDHLHDPLTGGESLADVMWRVSRFSDRLRSDVENGGSVAVVGHFWTCRALLGALLGYSLETTFEKLGYKPVPASIADVRCSSRDGDLRVVGWHSADTPGAPS